jgi:putative ABC transport system ATP-binding protein
MSLALSHVYQKYPGSKEETLKDISYSFPDTGLFFLIGKSGSGKTTLLSLLGLMDRNYRGRISYQGKDFSSFSRKEEEDYRFFQVSFAFQDFQVEEKDTVHNILREALSITTLSPESQEERIGFLLRKVGLLEKKDALFSTLSGGEKKRISLVRSLLRDNSVVLLDEPLTSLNCGLRKEITSLLLEQSKKRLLIAITHEEEEIPKEAAVLRLEDGRLIEERKGETSGQLLTPKYQRRSFSGLPLWKKLLETFRVQKEYLALTFLSLTVSLFAVSFSFLLSGGVKDSLSASLSSYMEENSLVVRENETGLLGEGYTLSSFGDAKGIEARQRENILAAKDIYLTNPDLLLPEQKQVSLLFHGKSLKVDGLDLSSFLEAELPGEVKGEERLYQSKEKTGKDIVLGASPSFLRILYQLLSGKESNAIDSFFYRDLLERIESNSLSLRVQAARREWSYYLDDSYRVSGFVVSDHAFLLSEDPLFANSFVHDVLHFQEYYTGERTDYPASLEKGIGLIVRPEKEEAFLRSFLADSKADAFALFPLSNQVHYRKEDILTHNRFLLYKDYTEKLSYSRMEEYKKKNSGIKDVSYSTPFFTYTANGYVSGFTKPFFFSLNKEKLNALEDENLYSEEDLGLFQSQQMKAEEGTYTADLLSSMQKGGLKFHSLEREDSSLLYGRKPQNAGEIAISSSFASTLFKTPEKACGEELHVLVLVETKKTGDKYQNRFSEGKLKITGIYKSEELVLYQDSLFPLCYSFLHFPLAPSEIGITEALFHVDLSKKSEEQYLDEVRKLGPFQGNFPMLSMLQDIEKTMKNLSNAFLLFSILSVISSAFLFSLSLSLILEKERKQIGVELSLGFHRKEILRFLFLFSSWIGIISFLSSLVLTLFARRSLFQELGNLLSVTRTSLLPFLVSGILSLFLICSTFFVIWRKTKEISPKEALTRPEL